MEIGSEEGAQLAGLAKQAGSISNIFKGTGVFGATVTTSDVYYKTYNQIKTGDLQNALQHRDILDASIGTVGLGATVLATFGIISNPVGWDIGIGVLGYGIGTLIYDAATE